MPAYRSFTPVSVYDNIRDGIDEGRLRNRRSRADAYAQGGDYSAAERELIAYDPDRAKAYGDYGDRSRARRLETGMAREVAAGNYAGAETVAAKEGSLAAMNTARTMRVQHDQQQALQGWQELRGYRDRLSQIGQLAGDEQNQAYAALINEMRADVADQPQVLAELQRFPGDWFNPHVGDALDGLIAQYQARLLTPAQALEMEANAAQHAFRQRQQGEIERHNRAMEGYVAARTAASAARSPRPGTDPFTRAAATADVRRLGDMRATADRDVSIAARLQPFLALNQQEPGTGPGAMGSWGVGDWRPLQNQATQQMQQIISELTPQMREPGSGTTSDFDAQMFRQALPALNRNPGANRAIISAYQARAQLSAQRADAAEGWAQAYRTLGPPEPGRPSFDAAWRAYVNANPIFAANSTPDKPSLNIRRETFENYINRTGGLPEAQPEADSGGDRDEFSDELEQLMRLREQMTNGGE